MTNLVVEVSRYLIILLIAIYTYYNFRFFSMKDQEGRDLACSRQLVCMFMLHFLANMVIVLNTGLESLALFYGAQVIFFLCYIYLYRFFYRNVSRLLVNNTCMRLCTSFIMLTRLIPSRAMRQFVIVAAAAVITWIIPLIIDRVWQLAKIPWIYCGLGLALLSAVCLLGNTSYGAQLSISIGGFSFQPSEFVKLTFVFFLAAVLSEKTGIRQVVAAGIGAAAHVLILVLSKDLGSALILFMVYVFLMTISAHQPLYLAGGLVAGAGASLLAYRMFSHVQVRVQAWRDPWSVIDKQGYQIAQALFAMSRGGLFGLGIGKGTPQDIPYVETDFIFSAVIEELGLLFGIGILLTAAVLFVLMIRLAGGLADGFYRNLVVGFAILYLFQTFLTVGGGSKFIPLTGVTLPLVSYGGSSVMTTILMFGVIEGVFVLRYDEELRIEKQRRKKKRQTEETE